LIAYDKLTIESGYGGGIALPITSASISIGEQHKSRAIEPNDKGATFTLDLPAGPSHLQTFFDNELDSNLGAYYVYIDKMTG